MVEYELKKNKSLLILFKLAKLRLNCLKSNTDFKKVVIFNSN